MHQIKSVLLRVCSLFLRAPRAPDEETHPSTHPFVYVCLENLNATARPAITTKGCHTQLTAAGAWLAERLACVRA